MNFIRTLRPAYTPPSRYKLATYLLPAEEARVTILEEKRLMLMKLLTMMIDGWEDRVRRSIYGSLVTEPRERPVVLGLEDLTGERGTANKIVEISDEALKKKSVQPTDIIAIVTDNPTTMKAVCRKWTEKYPWVLVRMSSIELCFPLTTFGQELPCFLHSINTIIGKIIAFPLVKAALSRNTKIVSFFNTSHYWSGQLEKASKSCGVTRSMVLYTTSRFYALILHCLSVQEHLYVSVMFPANRWTHGVYQRTPTINMCPSGCAASPGRPQPSQQRRCRDRDHEQQSLGSQSANH